MACGIYKITNTINGKFYIGSTTRMNARKAEHKYRCKIKVGNSAIRSAVLKYGPEIFKFEVIEEFMFGKSFSKEYMNEVLESREQFYIDTLKPEYNLRIKDVTRCLGVISEKQIAHLKRISKFKRDRSGCKKPIYQTSSSGEIIKEFDCAISAEKELNLNSGSVCRVLSGKYSNTKGYYFKNKIKQNGY